MLTELYIRDFAIIDELRLAIAPGFTVLTGETGAGKSIILDAVTLLLGGRADSSMIRANCEAAYLEGSFILAGALQAGLRPLLEAEGLEGEAADQLVLARDLRANGRNICRVNGRSVSLNLLRQVGELLVDIHGQGEHLSLLRPRAHLPLLDAYAGLDEERQALGQEVRALRKVQQTLEQLRREARTVAQRLDMLQFQVEEISAANLKPDEEEALRAERMRLANVERLMQHTNETLALLLGVDADAPSVTDLLSQAERAVSLLARLDESKQGWAARLQGLVTEFDELAGELRDYVDELEFNPGRLDFVEERLELIAGLKRKYGDDIPAVLAYRDKAVAELAQISRSEAQQEELAAAAERYLRRIGQMGQALSQKRQLAANKLATTVERELADLRMSGALFAVDFQVTPAGDGAYVGDQRLAFDQSGIDKVEFLISTNPGEPLKPMARVASGGETARLMLALKTALAQVDATPTLIFDEIDQGIGGRVGDIVGRKLWGLTTGQGHQVVVVTHLPQLAGYGDSHLHVSKHQEEGRTITAVAVLDMPGRVQELAAMLGTREHAQSGAESILRQAAAMKAAA